MANALVTCDPAGYWYEVEFGRANRAPERDDVLEPDASLQFESRVSSEGSFCSETDLAWEEEDDAQPDVYERHLAPAPQFTPAYHASPEFTARWKLAAIRAKLVALQPQVKITVSTMDAAFALAAACSLRSTLGLSACLWLAVKLCSVRTQSPCRALMASAAGVRPCDLAGAELHVATYLDWDLVAVIREAGICL